MKQNKVVTYFHSSWGLMIHFSFCFVQICSQLPTVSLLSGVPSPTMSSTSEWERPSMLPSPLWPWMVSPTHLIPNDSALVYCPTWTGTRQWSSRDDTLVSSVSLVRLVSFEAEGGELHLKVLFEPSLVSGRRSRWVNMQGWFSRLIFHKEILIVVFHL